MATVYSLICFGGRLGKTVTFTDAGDVVNLTLHGLRTATRVVFSTTGTLPTGLAVGTVYYAKRGADDNKFLLFPTSADAVAGTNQVAFSGTGSGTHTVKSQRMIELLAAHTGRWGSVGSERCYDGLISAIAARAGADALDEEVWELGEAFNEIYSGPRTITVYCAALSITSTIAGARTEAYHGGVVGNGYILEYGSTSQTALNLGWYGRVLDGFTVHASQATGTASGVAYSKSGNVLTRMIIRSSSGNGNGVGLTNLSVLECSLVTGFNAGTIISQYTYGHKFLGNTITANTGYGVYSTNGTISQIYGFYYNNISIGNGLNWGPQSPQVEGASGNAGLSTDSPWVNSGGSTVVMTTTDFVDWSNNDFRPASVTSPQVDSGVSYYSYLPFDIADGERPNYNNGGSEGIDAGCYEFDHGFGPHPASATISLTSIVSGSRVLITKANDGTVLYNDVPGTSLSFNTTHIGDFNVVVRKATASPFYREFNASGTTVADQTTSIKCLQQLDE